MKKIKEKKNNSICVRCTDTELELLREKSFLEGKSLSTYVLDTGLANIERPKNNYKKAIREIVELTEILNQVMRSTDDNCRSIVLDGYKKMEEENNACIRNKRKK